MRKDIDKIKVTMYYYDIKKKQIKKIEKYIFLLFVRLRRRRYGPPKH